MTARTRALAALAAGALALPLSPFAPSAFANHIDVQPTATDCPKDQVSDNQFSDVDDDNLFVTQINCITDYGVALGKTATTYGPSDNVLRRQMALFIYRVGLKAGVQFDTTTDPGFTDDDDLTGETKDAVWGLANASVVLGKPDGRYVPNGFVTRDQMASFIARVQGKIGVEGYETDEDFFDDDNGNVHEDNINAIASEGITVGRGSDRSYAPREDVTRQQMAGFLARKLNILVEQDFVDSVYDQQQAGGATDAPELTEAAFVRRTGAEGDERTTVRFTFDEDVIAGVDAGQFHLVTFDGQRFDGQQAQREAGSASSVLVVFGTTDAPVGEETFADVTVATTDAAAVSDSDGNDNPIGDAPLGSGVANTAGRTTAPDVVSIGGFRAEPVADGETSTRTLVDFTFDEAAYVADPNGFQLIFDDGSQAQGTATDTTADEDDAVDGDGTATITVAFDNAAGNELLSADDVARGVTDAGAVSDETVTTTGTPPSTSTDGDTNPLEVTDQRTGTTLPDLTAVTLDPAASTVTYTFDENVTLGEGAMDGFAVYDRHGVETSGTPAADELPAVETTADDTVVVDFAQGALDDVAGASVAENSAREDLAAGARGNQEDELGVASAATAAGFTQGPDLTDVARSEETTQGGQDPITGEPTSSSTTVTVTYTFDEDVVDPSTPADGTLEGFFLVLADGSQVDVSDSCALTDTSEAGDEDQVDCTFTSSTGSDGTTSGDDLSNARSAVGGAVDDGAVADGEGDVNPEGFEVVTSS